MKGNYIIHAKFSVIDNGLIDRNYRSVRSNLTECLFLNSQKVLCK